MTFTLAATLSTPATASTGAADQRETWQVTDFPVRYAGLDTVEVTGETAVTVGFGITAASRFTPLAAVWDGSAWTRQPVRMHDRSSDIQLADVDVTSTTSGWAVGSAFGASGSVAVSARWNGTAWTGVPVDDIAGEVGFLGVHMVGRDDVWAVGQKQVGSRLFPVIGHYDGKAWTAVETPTLRDVGSETALLSITADDDGTLWAVGQGGVSLRYDGRRWKQVSVPEVGGAYIDFEKVRWLGADGLWAVGFATYDGGRHPVALHWEDQAWQRVQVPNKQAAQLEDVARTDRGVVAVGYGHSGFYGLRLSVDGPSRPIDLPPGRDSLFGVAGNDAGTELWVVGSGPVGDQGDIAPYAAVRQ